LTEGWLVVRLGKVRLGPVRIGFQRADVNKT
jgi:hypothetical protein